MQFVRRYPTTRADLWEAVTTPDRLARWFAPVEGDLTPGGSFTIRFDDGDVPDWRAVTCDAPLAFDWEWDQGATDVEIARDGDKAVLRLLHTRLTADRAPESARADRRTSCPLPTTWGPGRGGLVGRLRRR